MDANKNTITNTEKKGSLSCDYIATIKKEGNLLKLIQIPIYKPTILIEELQAMVKNPNRTVYDIQCKFLNDYSSAEKSWYICYPHNYEASYLTSIKYPEFKSYTDIKDSWEKAYKDKIDAYKISCKNNSIVFNEATAKSLAEEEVAKLKEYQKATFFEHCKRWIDANELQVQSLKLKEEENLLMYSKEDIGWNNFSYTISNDLKISIATNFGYGRSAYFFLSVKYKNLEIVPYSFIVKYYKAYMIDIIRCTRQYSPHRESWEAAFDFVIDIANQAQKNPENFIREYVMNEVREMMSGLKSIFEDPRPMIKKMINFKTPKLLINVRDILKNEQNRMTAYPSECIFLFQVEKITDALYLMESLKNVASTFEDTKETINEYIKILLSYNFELYPQIQEQYRIIENRIESEKTRLSTIETNRENIIAQLKPYEKELKSLCKDTSYIPYNESEKFKRENPSYARLLEEKQILSKEISKIQTNIQEYENFNKILDKSLKLIDSVSEVA